MYIPHVCLVPKETRRGYGYTITGVMDGCESPCMCWELNSGSLQEQQVILTTEPCLQPHFIMFLNVCMCALTKKPEKGARFI